MDMDKSMTNEWRGELIDKPTYCLNVCLIINHSTKSLSIISNIQMKSILINLIILFLFQIQFNYISNTITTKIE